MHNFKNIIAWQKSRILVKDIYLLLTNFPVEERYNLVSQIRRSAISIPSNIAEGSGRGTKKDFKRFLDIAIASSFELETQMILAMDLNYLLEHELKDFTNKIEEVQKLIYGLIKSLKIQITNTKQTF